MIQKTKQTKTAAKTTKAKAKPTKSVAKAVAETKTPPVQPTMTPEIASGPTTAGTGPLIFIVSVLIGAVLLGGAYATWPFWSARVLSMIDGNGVDKSRLADLGVRLEALESRVGADTNSTIQDLEAERKRVSGKVAELLQRMNELEKKTAEVNRLINATSLPNEAGVVEKSLQQLSERLAKVEKQEDTFGHLSDRVGNLESSKTDVSKSGDDVENLVARSERLASAVAGFSKRLKTLETKPEYPGGASQLATDKVRIVLAINRLRDRLRTSARFVDELGALRLVAKKNTGIMTAIAGLETYADTGIPSLSVVRGRFDAAATEIARAAAMRKGDGWVQKTVNRLSSMVVVRTSRDGGSSSTDDRLARAEESLTKGNLVQAVQALDGLKGKPAEAAGSWLKTARARLKAEKVMVTLHVYAASLLSTAGE